MADAAIRVLIADDHPVVRQGLRAFLETREGLEVVGEAGDGNDALTLAASMDPDVVLMDLVMPGVDGVAAIRELAERAPRTRVVVITSYGSDDRVDEAVQAGVAGFLLKDAHPSEIEAAIRAAHRGEAHLAPSVTAAVLRRAHARDRASANDPGLTPREREVLALLARGQTNSQIADGLVIAVKTVKTHVSAILDKLGVDDRTQAAVLALRSGLVDVDDE